MKRLISAVGTVLVGVLAARLPAGEGAAPKGAPQVFHVVVERPDNTENEAWKEAVRYEIVEVKIDPGSDASVKAIEKKIDGPGKCVQQFQDPQKAQQHLKTLAVYGVYEQTVQKGKDCVTHHIVRKTTAAEKTGQETQPKPGVTESLMTMFKEKSKADAFARRLNMEKSGAGEGN